MLYTLFFYSEFSAQRGLLSYNSQTSRRLLIKKRFKSTIILSLSLWYWIIRLIGKVNMFVQTPAESAAHLPAGSVLIVKTMHLSTDFKAFISSSRVIKESNVIYRRTLGDFWLSQELKKWQSLYICPSIFVFLAKIFKLFLKLILHWIDGD